MLFQQEVRPASCFRVWVIPSSDQQFDSAHPSTTCPLRSLAVQDQPDEPGKLRRSFGFGCRLALSHHWQRATQPSRPSQLQQAPEAKSLAHQIHPGASWAGGRTPTE